MQHRFTQEQRLFITKNVIGRGNAELTEMFNAQFCLNLGLNQIKAFKKNNKLSSGLDGRFKPGTEPLNKGTKGLTGANSTSFKKGTKPHNYKPVGYERVNGAGYVVIKIAAPNKWRGKHQLIWEEANGPIPKGHVIVFGDGNRRNFELNNLILVSQKQLFYMNRNNLIKDNAELTRTGVIVADIFSKINERKKSK